VRAASIFRRARFVSQGLAFQNPRLLNHARKVRDRLFVDDDRRLRLSLPDDPREVSTGQDGQEAGCPYPIKAHPAPVGNHLIGWARNMAVPLLGGLQRLFDPINAGAGGTRKNPAWRLSLRGFSLNQGVPLRPARQQPTCDLLNELVLGQVADGFPLTSKVPDCSETLQETSARRLW